MADIDNILEQLTIDEKISLVSGTDFWHTASIPRLGIPAIRVSDGPNGVRGTKFFNGKPAACFPCGTAIGATWNTALVESLGQLQGQEAIAKGASAILGPTVNMQRSPLNGRGFESFSEDPVLSGCMGAAIINGIQSQGVAATVKHFVCNDQEDQRQLVDSVVTQRALREIYLMPFQIAQRDARPACYMTAYNRVNGIHCSENPALIQKVLREEWNFDGLVMSDWFGTYSTTEALRAGLDLEMPGPSLLRGRLTTRALSCGKLLPHELDDRVREVLKFIQSARVLNIPENAPEGMLDTPETAAQLRHAAAESIVMLKNERNILPLKYDKTTAVIGPNALIAAYCGGGSAALDPYHAISPLEGIRARMPQAKYALGAPGWKLLPPLSHLTRTESGQPGLDMTVYLEGPESPNRNAVDQIHVSRSEVFLMDYKNPHIQGYLYYADLSGTFTPDVTAEYEFSICVAGTAKLFIDGECIVDNASKQTRGDSFFGTGTVEEKGEQLLEAGKTYHIKVEFGTDPTITFDRPGSNGFGAGGIRLGAERKVSLQEEIDSAVDLARQVDQVVLCMGLNSDWESEGYDRSTMNLPPGSDALIEAVLAANPNTAVVIQSGTPVTMPWIDQVPGLIQAWYGGNETGHAIADVLFGRVNPSGRLPLTFPRRCEDNPAFVNYRSERNRVLYGEDVYVGYRWYERTKQDVLFPFGYGLSYTSFEFSNFEVKLDEQKITVSVDVTNIGSVGGAQVVQVYVSHHQPSVCRPVKELKIFTKEFLRDGEMKRATMEMSRKYATSFWDEARQAWTEERGNYTILVGDPSSKTSLSMDFQVENTRFWNGL
ncbi:hypothetical protein AtubIFM57258_008031 [Aspergillus tubingensis]|nr:hypothetical protein AtubIFM57258_008031 [Aspergillus tubingensis]